MDTSANGYEKKKNIRRNKLKVSLSEKDMKMLRRYCRINKMSQNAALKRLLRESLANELKSYEEMNTPPNQLDLFAPVQMNIFD